MAYERSTYYILELNMLKAMPKLVIVLYQVTSYLKRLNDITIWVQLVHSTITEFLTKSGSRALVAICVNSHSMYFVLGTHRFSPNLAINSDKQDQNWNKHILFDNFKQNSFFIEFTFEQTCDSSCHIHLRACTDWDINVGNLQKLRTYIMFKQATQIGFVPIQM